MGIADKARRIAEQAQAKLDEVRQHKGERASDHGEAPAAGPAPEAGPQARPAGAGDLAATPQQGDPMSPAPPAPSQKGPTLDAPPPAPSQKGPTLDAPPAPAEEGPTPEPPPGEGRTSPHGDPLAPAPDEARPPQAPSAGSEPGGDDRPAG